MSAPESQNLTHAERIDQDHEDRRAAYAAEALRQGQFLSVSNGPDGRINGLCALDARRDRDWYLRLTVEPRLRK